MNEISFEGSIEQAVAGNVVNKGPRFNNQNVVNVNLKGSADDRKLSGDCLTFQQKRAISLLVNKIARAAGCDSLLIWNQVLARAGAKKVKFIPKEEYRDLDNYLEGWLAEVEKPLKKSSESASVPGTPLPESQARQEIQCSHCEHSKSALSKISNVMRMALLLASAAIAAAVYLGIKTYKLSGQLQNARVEATGCQFDDKAYSLGSIIKGEEDIGNIECGGNPPQWKAEVVATKTEKKPLLPKIHAGHHKAVLSQVQINSSNDNTTVNNQ